MTLKRKVVAFNYSKMIVIPKQWCEMKGIKTGDYLTMEVSQDGNLILVKRNEEKNGGMV